jgi:addiction module HigA family antidote
LRILNNATSLEELRIPPGNRLEALKGNLAGLHSISINSQWRICFRWQDSNAHDVQITDYHLGQPQMNKVTGQRLPNIHPGEILLEEFLKPMDISQNALARSIDVPPRRINEIVLGKRSISADTAVRLSRAFGISARFWLGLQADYDLEEAQLKLGAALDRIDCIAA